MLQPRPSRTLNPTRRALLGAGVATLALSLALSIAPAWAKSNSSGAVKIRDASTGDLIPDSSNDPQVCTFRVVFEYDPPTTGAWQIVSWPPTGDGSQVAGGTWSAVVGVNQTDAMALAAGHYRLVYQASGDPNSKSKTFWVDDSCAPSGGLVGGGSPSDSPNESPAASPSDAQSDAPSDSPSASPSDSPSDTPSESPSDSPSDAPSDAPSDSPSDAPSDSPSHSPSDSPSDSPSEQPSDSPSETPSESPRYSPSDSPSEQPSQDPEGGVQGVSGGASPSARLSEVAGGTKGVTSPEAGNRNPTLPNTATAPPSVLSPLLAALGLLMLIAAHPFIRLSALADRA